MGACLSQQPLTRGSSRRSCLRYSQARTRLSLGVRSQIGIMEIPSKKVYEVLNSSGVKQIYHTNSVITSCQFLRRGALLSRGTIARSGLYQTAQKSDETDKKLGIWFDVFADSDDIHHRATRANAYGPVLFVLDIELIAKAYTGKVWVTKLNPTKWNAKTHKQRWFVSEKDLEDNFVKGRFDHMIVFRHCGGELPIKKYLKKIILDDPRLVSKPSNIDYYSMAYGALQLSMTDGQISAPILKRECQNGCTCQAEYSADPKRSKEMYVPKI